MSSTVVTLSCPNHAAVFLNTLWNYYQKNYKVDVEIRSKGQAIFAHQLVLSVFCPKLKPNLDSDVFSTDKHLTVGDVTDDGELLAVLLEFMYRGEVSVEEIKLTDLKDAASKLGMDGLVTAIDTLAKDDNDNNKVITPKKTSARRRKPVKPVKTLPVDDDDDIEDNDNFDDDWSDYSEHDKPKISKKVKFSNEEVQPANNEVGVAEPKRKASPRKNNTERKRQWRLRQPIQNCPHCSFQTRNKYTLSNHVALHENPPEIRTCSLCEKRFRNKLSYERHIMCHTDDSRLHRCERCQFRTANKSDLVEHLGSVHMVDVQGNPLDEIKCEQCDYKCFTKQRLKQHVLRQHTDKVHKCDRCEYSAVVLCDLMKHIRVRHDNVRSYQCDICGKRFKTTSALNSHSRSHSGIKACVCETCGQAFAKPESLKFHTMKHEGDKKPYVCHICGKRCRRRDNLQMHLRRIHKTNDMSFSSLDETIDPKSTDNSAADNTVSTSMNTSTESKFPDFHDSYIGFVTGIPNSAPK